MSPIITEELLCLEVYVREGRADEDHRAKVRCQAAHNGDDQYPKVLFAPPLAGLRSGNCRSVWGVVIVTHGRESTPQAAPRGAT